jgi:hypothetical protein
MEERRFAAGSVACSRGHRGLGSEGQDAQREGPRPGWLEAASGPSAQSGVGAEALSGWRRAYEGRGKRWVEEVLGLSVEIVRRPPKPIPEEVARSWAQEEWAREGKKVDWRKLMLSRGFVVLPRRWVVERTFSWLAQSRRMRKDSERLCATSEAFVYAAMACLMV